MRTDGDLNDDSSESNTPELERYWPGGGSKHCYSTRGHSFDVSRAGHYPKTMGQTKRMTVYFDRELHRSLSKKAAQSDPSISYVVNEAVRPALAEAAEDLKAFRERAAEPNLEFVDVVKSLKRRGKL